MNDQPTTTTRIAGALGDPCGSYELLIGSRICTALGLDPDGRGPLVPTAGISDKTVAWLHGVADAAAPDAGYATELLAALNGRRDPVGASA